MAILLGGCSSEAKSEAKMEKAINEAVSEAKSEAKKNPFQFHVAFGEAQILNYIGPDKEITIPSTLNKYPTTIAPSAFSSYNNRTIVTSVKIEQGVRIDERAFESCTGITTITIPSGATRIESGTFQGCTGLTSINIPQSVTSIGEGALRDCKNLKSINIPQNVITIGNSAFSNCTSLTNVNLPESVKEIAEYTFSGCTGLATLTFNSAETIIPQSVGYVEGIPSTTKIIGHDPSTAKNYATRNNLKFEVIK